MGSFSLNPLPSLLLIFDADGVVSPGADNFYRNILGLRKEHRRDVFQRVNSLELLYEKCRRKFRTIIDANRSIESSKIGVAR